MLRIALKSASGNVLRLALTGLAVVLGVAFVAGTFVLTDSIDAAFDGLFEEANAGVDVYVNPVTAFEFAGGGPPGVDQSGGATLDQALLDEVQQVDGVADAIGLVEGLAPLISPEGDRIGGQGPPTLGFSWAGEDGPISLREGEPPTGPDDVVIDITTFEEEGFALGDTVTVLLADGPQDFTIVGASGFGEEDSLLGATTASFTLERAQEIFGKEGRFDQIAIAAEEGVETLDLVDAVAAVVASDDVEVVSVDQQIAQQTAELNEGLAFLDYVLLSFAGVSLFVGAFLIVNTFTIIVAQRMREFALLRAVGASAGQLRWLVMIEAGIIGLLGGGIGLLGGIGLSELLRAIFGALGAPFPDGGLVLEPRTYIASFGVAIGVTLMAALLPALRAARVSPVEALRGTGAADTDHIGAPRTIMGALVSLAGIAALVAGLTLDTSINPVALVGGGVGGMFIGVALLAPWIVNPAVNVLGAVFGRSTEAKLARRNAQRNPTRTSTTASALTIGVALVSFITVVAYSANASIAALFEEQYGADLTVSVQGGFGTIPTAVAGEVAAVDGVASVNPVRLSQAVVPGEDTGFGLFVNGVDAGVVGDHLDLGVDESALAALERPDTAIVKQGVAEDEGLEVGDTYRLSFPSRSDVPLEIVGIAEAADVLDGAFIVDLATYEDVVGGASDQLVTVLLEEGADVDEAQAAVEEAVSDYPGTQVQTNNELLESIEQQVFTFLAIVFGLLVLALLIAFIGIANTLALSVLERTREIGMLRAVGMVRSQLRGIVYREAILVSAFGALLGIVIGTLFGWALVTALADEGINVLVVPPLNMIAYVVVASIAGVLAALWPGYRAARMNVLDAIYEE